MKHYLTISLAILLSACGGPALPVREFLQDKQNDAKFDELSAKFKKEHGCDKLDKLYKFTKLENPSVKDLSEIMPIFGLKADDAKNVDKVYNLDLSVMNKYNCDDVGNKDQLINELVQYCNDKYHDTPDKQSDCEYYLKQSIFVVDEHHALIWSILDKRKAIQDVKDTLETGIVNNIQKIYPMPKGVDYLLSEFRKNELVKASNEVLGKYDGECIYNGPYAYTGEFTNPLCDYDTKIVTRLNSARVLYKYCVDKTFLPNDKDYDICICYAHETYQKVNYKNVLYIYEKEDLPQSKKTEFNQMYKKCKQKIEQQQKKAEKERYGEAKNIDKYENNVFTEALENAAWAHETITDVRKRSRKRNIK